MKSAKMVPSRIYSPTMTKDYSRISDTARAVNAEVLPRMASYIRRISPQIAAMNADDVFLIADYGAADGVNSSKLFESHSPDSRSESNADHQISLYRSGGSGKFRDILGNLNISKIKARRGPIYSAIFL